MEGDADADIEGGLIEVGDDEVGFGGEGHDEGEVGPGAGGVEGAVIVPGAHEGEDLGAEAAGEEAVEFIDAPDERGG